MGLAESEQERVWFAREVFNLFVKCFTNLKLYPHDHVHCVTSLKDFSSRLRSYVKLHGVLRIGVGKDTLSVQGQSVYEQENRNENLAFRLYVDGLREISISQGVTRDEAVKLAHVFYQAVSSPDADTTGLLWEGDFTNVDYAAINSLSEAWESPNFFSADNLALLKEMNQNVGDIVDSLTAHADHGTYSFELSDGAAEVTNVDLEVTQADAREEDGDIFEVSAAALSEFQQEVQSWGPDRLLQAVVEHSLDGYALLPQIIDAETTSWLLKEALDMAMRSKDMDLVSALLTRYAGELDLVEEEEDEDVFRYVFAWLAQDENLSRLVRMARAGALGGPKAFVRILGLMGEGGVHAAAATYLEADTKELKDALLSFLEANAKEHPHALAPLLQPDQPAAVVRSGMFVVNKRVRGKALAELLEMACAHKDPEVKKYATHLWRTKTKEGQEAILIESLGSESRTDRMRAVTTLVKKRRKDAIEKMKQVIGDPSFLQRDPEERRVFIDGLRRLGGQTAVAFLDSQTRRATGLFNRKAVKEIRQLAQKALEDFRREGGSK